MSKPPRTDFKALIADDLALGLRAEPAPPPPEAPPPPAAPAAPASSSPREVVALKQRRAAPMQRPAGQGTLKERAHQLSLYLEGPVYDALRDIAHVERTKLHPLILEGIDLLLRNRGAPSIKELTKKAG
jgi:hypothetical protein